MVNGKVIRIQMIQSDLHFKDLAQSTAISYDRLMKVINGYRTPKPGEVKAIAAALGLSESTVAGEAGYMESHDERGDKGEPE